MSSNSYRKLRVALRKIRNAKEIIDNTHIEESLLNKITITSVADNINIQSNIEEKISEIENGITVLQNLKIMMLNEKKRRRVSREVTVILFIRLSVFVCLYLRMVLVTTSDRKTFAPLVDG